MKEIKTKILKTKYLFSTLIVLFFSKLITGNVYADSLSTRIDDVKNSNDAASFTEGILNVAIPIAVLSMFGLGLHAGYKMITSKGDPEKINEAKEIITNAVLGFALIGLSVAVLMLIQSVLQIPI